MDQKTKDELREAARQYVQHWLSNPDDDAISDHLADFEIANNDAGYPTEDSIAYVRGLLADASFELEGEQEEE